MGRPITVDEFIAFNDEIAAIVRAGIPLESGLRHIGQELPGHLGKSLAAVAEDLNAGQSLSQAMASQGGRVPDIYAALVDAGMRSGRLPAALESLAVTARRLAEMRRTIASAAVYPIIVLLLAYAMFVGFILFLAPVLASAYATFRLPLHGTLEALAGLGESAIYWGPIFPGLLLLLILAWSQSTRSQMLQPAWSTLCLAWIPWARAMLVNSRLAGFADILRLLVEHGVPLHESLELSARCTGDRKLQSAVGELADAVQRGESIDRVHTRGVLPALFGWCLAAGQRQGTLVTLLQHTAETYRDRALRHADSMQIFLPVLAVGAVGVVVGLLFVFTVFVPFSTLMQGIAFEHN